MSWFLGAFGLGAGDVWRSDLEERALEPLLVRQSEGGCLLTGGLPATCLRSGTTGGERGGWVVVGTATEETAAGSSLLGEAGWRSRMEGASPDLAGLAGHFAGLRWRDPHASDPVLVGFVGPLGIRSLFYVRVRPSGEGPSGGMGRAPGSSHLLVSTRPDWLARIAGCPRIDFSTLGSHWLLANQLADDALLEGVERLGPGRRLVLDRGEIRISGSSWEPAATRAGGRDRGMERDGRLDGRGQPGERLARAFRAGVRLRDSNGISIGLSGGLDSRTVLAAAKPGAGTHTFGPLGTADAVVARTLAKKLGLDHEQLWEPVPDGDACVALARDHALRTCAISPGSAALRLRFFARLHEAGVTVLDGGFGEIARRGYYRRLVREAPGALQGKNAGRILSFLRVPRAHCFGEEVFGTMQEGAARDLERVLEELPEVPERSTVDLAELMAVRTRLPNFFGREQARMDGAVRSVMPFARPELLEAVFRTPVDLRTSARWARDLVWRRARPATDVPLARGDVLVPYGMPDEAAFLWSRLKRTAGWSYPDPTRWRFLDRIEDWARQTVRTRAVREYGPYDYGYLRTLVDGYYRGAHRRARELDWWVAFECWRAGLRGSNG